MTPSESFQGKRVSLNRICTSLSDRSTLLRIIRCARASGLLVTQKEVRRVELRPYTMSCSSAPVWFSQLSFCTFQHRHLNGDDEASGPFGNTHLEE